MASSKRSKRVPFSSLMYLMMGMKFIVSSGVVKLYNAVSLLPWVFAALRYTSLLCSALPALGCTLLWISIVLAMFPAHKPIKKTSATQDAFKPQTIKQVQLP